jgi:hypothetical protein
MQGQIKRQLSAVEPDIKATASTSRADSLHRQLTVKATAC